MRLFDGELYSEWGNSTNLTILNSPPQITLNKPDNYYSTTNRTPQFNWTASDDDGDSLTYYINITCIGCSDDNRFESTGNTYYIPSVPLKYFADDNYYYNWTVKAGDGEVNTTTESRTFNITTLVIVSLSNNVSFGEMLAGEIENTTDDDPSPFLMRNDGNCFLNIGVNVSSWLWTTYQEPSSYYQFKVDNVTGEENAFNSSSITTWTNVSNQSSLISDFNYTDDRDEAEIDIQIEVPSDEPYGPKSSLLIFTGRYIHG